MSRSIVIAVDATERTLDALALGKLLANATDTPVVLFSVFPYDPLEDPAGDELSRVRDEARAILLELAESAAVEVADVQVVASNLVARELHRVTERDATGVMVLGSTSRGAVGRLLPGAMAERLLAGAAAPLAIAPRSYSERPAGGLERIGVGFDGSDESRHALEAGRLLARSAGAQLRVITVFERLTFGAVAVGRTAGDRSTSCCERSVAAFWTRCLPSSPRRWPWRAGSSRDPRARSSPRRAPTSICS